MFKALVATLFSFSAMAGVNIELYLTSEYKDDIGVITVKQLPDQTMEVIHDRNLCNDEGLCTELAPAVMIVNPTRENTEDDRIADGPLKIKVNEGLSIHFSAWVRTAQAVVTGIDGSKTYVPLKPALGQVKITD